jgi:serine phosphatase RsbU (regulator of sigma subunit)/anti-sigma regulatory factor (Ser/Thr protein kinase)
MVVSAFHSTAAQTLRLDTPCDLSAVRDACHSLREFLGQARLAEAELDAWELVLMEAGNNAVKYAREADRHRPIRLAVSVSSDAVEAHVTDHTAGFDFPVPVALPPPDCETGRGLFLIRSLTDEARYFRDDDENCLILRRRRRLPVAETGGETLVHLKTRLDETQHTLDLMTEELASAYESLSAVFRFSTELSGQGQPEALARQWLETLLPIVQADWFVLRLAEHDGRVLRVVACSGDIHPVPVYPLEPPDHPGLPAAVRAALLRKDVWFDQTSPGRPDGAAVPHGPTGCGFSHPMMVNERLIGVLTMGRSRAEAAFQAQQVNVIETFADFLGLQICNAWFQEEQLRSRLVTHELEIAANLQHSLLPARLPEPAGFRLASHIRSARQVGGDFYDVLAGASGALLLVIADVMGKGMPAALFATIFRTLVHARRDLAAAPGRFLSWLNSSLTADLAKAEMFVTAQLVFVDPGARRLRVAGAGHPPLLLADATGTVRAVESAAPPLGIGMETDYPEESFVLPAGAHVLLYTDGLTEARNAAGAFFGLDALKEVFGRTARERLSAEATKERLIARLAAFENSSARADDQAFLLLVEES